MKILKPFKVVDKVIDADYCMLWQAGKRGLLIDADNTLLPWGTLALPPGYREWLEGAKKQGFRIVVFTNNGAARSQRIKEVLLLPIVFGWVKPWPWGMTRALRELGLPRQQVLLLGDQIFTDILGANLMGIDSVLVTPLSQKEHGWTALMRKLERLAGRGR
jgi:HAD superfamily phosphatase (TIGR01668 family)